MPLADHVARSVQDTLLNAVWREQIMQQGYEGAAELMKRMQRVFETQCVCGNVSNEMMDQVVRTCLLDETMQAFFRENNPYAQEEAARRFLELDSRGKWEAGPDVLHQLKLAYLKAEGDLEDGVSGEGDIQGGSVDIVSQGDAAGWPERMEGIEEVIKKWRTSDP